MDKTRLSEAVILLFINDVINWKEKEKMLKEIWEE